MLRSCPRKFREDVVRVARGRQPGQQFEQIAADFGINESCLAAPSSAVARRGEFAGCAVHSDRGSQLRSRKFAHAIGRAGMVGSMGRVGAAGDNAAMESSFALLQKNVLDWWTWATRNDLQIAIFT